MSTPHIPIGLVFSQSGPYQMMASEMLKGALMAVAEVNASHAFGFELTPHLRDPAGVVTAYHTACEDLIRKVGVDHIVGCYTSASRKQILPIIERTDRLLWHPARYEGFECSDSVIYVGAAPNHNIVPLMRHMLDHVASDVFCVGSNYVWTWEINRVTRDFVNGAGGRILAERLLELGDLNVQHIVSEIISRRPPVVFNTLVGETSYYFMRALHAAASDANLSIPVLSCSLCEPELAMIGGIAAAGCITSSAYFETIALEENRSFVSRWKARHGEDSHPSVDSQSTYVAIMLMARAIERAGSTEVNQVRRAAANHHYQSPQGPVWVDPDNNHCFLTPRLAKATREEQFEIFWQADAPEKPDPYLSALDLAIPNAAHDTDHHTIPSHFLRVVK